MEEAIPSLALWLSSHAVAFFAIATALALLILMLLWYAIVRYTTTWSRWVREAFAAFERHASGMAFDRVKRAGGRMAAFFTAYAVIALSVALAGAYLFFKLADEIRPGEDMAVFDEAFAAGLGTAGTRSAFQFFSVATHLGDPLLLTAVSTLVAIVLLCHGKLLLFTAWIAATSGNALLTRLLKVAFARARPLYDHALAAPEGWSFPSGHASGSLAVFTMLVYVVLRGRKLAWWHVPLLLITMAAVLLVGFSRVFMRVHYVSDVLGGYIVATSWLAICIAGVEMARAWAARNAQARSS